MAMSNANSPSRKSESVRVYQHSDLVYWWLVWVYGYFCAALSFLFGVPIAIGAEKAVNFYPDTWLGISYISVVVLVLVTTSAKAKGIFSLVLFMIVGALAALVQYAIGFDQLMSVLSLALVHMNQAFYIFISTAILFFWVIITFGVERFKVWKFSPGTITMRLGFMDEEHVFKASAPLLKRIPDDFIVHKVLGLAFLGFGMGDIEISFSTANGRERHELKNVWRATAVAQRIATLLGQQAVTTSNGS